MRLFGRRRGTDRPPPAYSNEAVIARIQEDSGVDRDTARAWFNEMLIFLDLVADSKEFISPPGPVDAAWHAFILHTRDYEAYCRERFGRVIHHEPTGEPDPRAYERRARQGQLDPAIWAVPAVWGGAAASEGDWGSGSPGGGDWGTGSSGGGDWGTGSSGGGDWGMGASGGGDFGGGGGGG